MGIEDKIKNMEPKKKKLYETIIMIVIILTLLYASLTILIVLNMDIMRFFMHHAFMESVVILVVSGLAWKILHGGKIQTPKEFMRREEK